MAIQTFKCPNCGSELKMDDNLEKGFCMYCESAIQIKEDVTKIRIEHSGKIEIDDSKKIANFHALADRAFEAHNYEECYKYCCNALECDISNIHLIFRKGLCAAYMSQERVNELLQAIQETTEIINNTSNKEIIDAYVHVIFSELLEYINLSYTVSCKQVRGFKYPDLESAENAFNIIAKLMLLCSYCVRLITDEMMSADPAFEKDVKICLEIGIELCEIGLLPLKYFDGYKLVKKGDNYVTKEVYQMAKSPFADKHKQYLDVFKDMYNNLPSTKKALMEYNDQIEILQKDIDAYTNNLKKYFKENPAIEKEYKKTAAPYFILMFASFALIGMIGVALSTKFPQSDADMINMIMSLCAVGSVVVFLVLAMIRSTALAKNRDRIISEFPAELIELKNIHDQSKDKLRAIKREKAKFEKMNVKK